jgi:hypothetical protein
VTALITDNDDPVDTTSVSFRYTVNGTTFGPIPMAFNGNVFTGQLGPISGFETDMIVMIEVDAADRHQVPANPPGSTKITLSSICPPG